MRRSLRAVRADLLFAVLLLLAVVASPVRAEKDKKGPDEAKAREKIARIWIDLGTYLAGRGYKPAAEEALAQAREATPTAAAALKPLEDAVAAATDAGAPDAEATKRREKAAKDAAKAWERLAEGFGDASDPHYGEYMLRAAALDGAKARIQRLAEAAKKTSIVVKSPKHPMTAWLSLPGGWKPGKTYPVLVSVEGAGANFAGNHGGFKSGRGARDMIVLTPFSLSSTNQLVGDKFPHYSRDILTANEAQGARVDWDNEGLLAVLDLLKEHFGAAEKVAITGFSGGGMLCYSFTMRHADRVRLCAPACGNFAAGLAGNGSAVTDGGPMVRISTGASDEYRDHVGQEPGIEKQTDAAVEAFGRLGFTDVKRKSLPGVGHSSCVGEVWKAVDEMLAAAH